MHSRTVKRWSMMSLSKPIYDTNWVTRHSLSIGCNVKSFNQTAHSPRNLNPSGCVHLPRTLYSQSQQRRIKTIPQSFYKHLRTFDSIRCFVSTVKTIVLFCTSPCWSLIKTKHLRAIRKHSSLLSHRFKSSVQISLPPGSFVSYLLGKIQAALKSCFTDTCGDNN